MHIANPIYDVIFKYMLEDNKVAKLFLSAIIGEEIEELDFSAQEKTVMVKRTVTDDEKPPLTVCRVDFSAKIRTGTGFKTVTIELQKAKFQSDLMRFRRYPGTHYRSSDNTGGDRKEKARQIYCIYILDYGMDLPECPVLKVDYSVCDVSTGDEYPASGEFVSGLHHRSWIVQIHKLKERRRNDLEKLLSIFDRSHVTNMRKWVIDVDEDHIPEAYRPIIRRLRKAMEDPGKQDEMELEDDIVRELQDWERHVEEMAKTIADKDRTIADNAKTIADNAKTIAELEKELAAWRVKTK